MMIRETHKTEDMDDAEQHLLLQNMDTQMLSPLNGRRFSTIFAVIFAIGLFVVLAILAPSYAVTGARSDMRTTRKGAPMEDGIGLFSQMQPEPKVPNVVGEPWQITPNDFWAIHDLLLVGYDAYFMKRDSEGQREVQANALELTRLMPQLHPWPPCREQIGAAMAGVDAGAPRVIAAAKAAWRCLPAHYDETSFTTAFVPQALWNPDTTKGQGELVEGLAEDARDPFLHNPHVLGACRGSHWPRTCSYWASIHNMAYRADALGLSARFMPAIIAVLAGGATMCGG